MLRSSAHFILHIKHITLYQNMSKAILLLVVLALGACCAVDRADLADVTSQTVCPIVQVVDEDEERVPKRIKMLKCGQVPTSQCMLEEVVNQKACCGQIYDKFMTKCVEVMDNVVVSIQGIMETIRVPVGCTCIVQMAKEATAIN